MGRVSKLKKYRNKVKKYQKFIKKYRNRPDLYVEDILGYKLLDYQRLWLRLIWKNKLNNNLKL